MKKIMLLAAAFVCLSQAYARETKESEMDSVKSERSKNSGMKSVMLQDVQVVSTRAGKNTPMAFQNFSNKEIKTINFGQDTLELISVLDTIKLPFSDFVSIASSKNFKVNL